MNGSADLALAGLAAIAAGATNALAGGGTLITFPTLTALGLPAVVSNVTNTVALCPGYLGGTLAQRKDLSGQGRRLRWAIPAGAIGGLGGGLLLLHTGEKTFREVVPWLILLAAALLAAQDVVKGWLGKRTGNGGAGRAEEARGGHGSRHAELWAAAPLCVGAVYGGYFGAGLGVILLAVLGLTLNDSLTRLNALKQAVSLTANVLAAVLFLGSGRVAWAFAGVMAAGALIGGAIGGRLAGRVRPQVLRWVVVAIGVAVGVVYLVR